MDELDCISTESSLADCSHSGWNTHNCHHTEDVSIQCADPYTIGKCICTGYATALSSYRMIEVGTIGE